MLSKATQRYAKTFFKVALDKDQLEAVFKDMNFVLKVFLKTRGIDNYFSNPVVTADMVNHFFLDKIQPHVNPLTLDFFNLLVRKNRVPLFKEVPTAFIEHYETHKNILRATIKSVQKLSDEQLLKIQDKLKIRTGAAGIIIKNIVDPKLIAGVQIKIGDTIIDANINNQLNQLKSKLAA